MDLRKRGERRKAPPRTGNPRRLVGDPQNAFHANAPGRIGVSSEVQFAIQHLYNTSPSIQAARQILMGQLLSSGVVVRRAGVDVVLKPTFARHLDDVWLPFARAVIDSFLMYGFVIVSLEQEAAKPFAPKPPSAAGSDPPDASGSRARKRPLPKANDPASNLVPIVPDIGQCDLSWIYTGENGYQREYHISTTNSQAVYSQDTTSEVFFKTPPDASGNMCSPIATVFQSASFISSLEELALQAEAVRTRQMLVTQAVQPKPGNPNLDPQNLFFDSESRAVQASATAEEEHATAQSLVMNAQLMRTINRLQTTDSGSQQRTGTAAPAHVPPAQPPMLFASPNGQQVVSGVRPPDARSDLVELIRVVNDHIAAAMGVPASVIFEGKFSSNSMSQLQLCAATRRAPPLPPLTARRAAVSTPPSLPSRSPSTRC